MKNKDLILVVIQFILGIIFILIPTGIPRGLIYQVIALLMVVAALTMVFTALINLGSNLTVVPTPKPGGNLVTNGIYKYIRHPIYSAILLLLAGVSVYSLNLPRFLVSLMFYLLFRYKAIYEESLLKEKFPEYNDYTAATGRFFPKIF